MARLSLKLLCIIAVVGLKCAYAQEILFSDGFESGTLDPVTWQANPGPPNGVVEVAADDGVAHDGIFGVRLGQSERGAPTTNALDLHLDLSGHEQIELSFWISSNNDESNVEDGLWFSDDGGVTFTHVFAFAPADWTQLTYGQFPPLDVDRLAEENGLALTANFVIRFQQHGSSALTAGSSAFRDGIFLDDVVVRTAPSTYAVLPFEQDSFETGVLGSAWHWGDPGRTLPPGTALPGGLVEVVSSDVTPNTGIFGVVLGRRVRGNETTNALDLRLDLSNHEQVMLSFWIYSNNDEISPQGDGIWFSDNGGETFRNVFTYDIPTNEYQQRILNVDALATSAGLSLGCRKF